MAYIEDMANKIVVASFYGMTPNFGDELGVYIISMLSKTRVIPKRASRSFALTCKYIIRSLKKLQFNNIRKALLPSTEHVLSVGSILANANKKSKVWGSGFMRETDKTKAAYENITAVRGYRTIEVLKKGNPAFDCPVGDPALLLPLLYTPKSSKNGKIAVIPHKSEFNYFKTVLHCQYDLINLESADVEKTIDEITSYDYILSTSLHGIIIAHAYGIPALWIEQSGLEKGTNGFKFYDYFSSVKIPAYSPIKDLSILTQGHDRVLNLFKQFKDSILPVEDLKLIQNNLLSVKPFK